MSLTLLKIISTNPSYIPAKISQDKAKDFLINRFRNQVIQLSTTSEIEFIDQGENFQKVSCNVCGQEFKIDSWQEAMDRSYEAKFHDLVFLTPCCSSETSLNDLIYDWPAGFSLFVLSVENPQKELDEADLKELQNILQTPLRIIWAHY